MAINDGGPAFPVVEYYDEKPIGSALGMSLRDYFAGQALIGLTIAGTGSTKVTADMLAGDAYVIADAMIAARNADGRGIESAADRASV